MRSPLGKYPFPLGKWDNILLKRIKHEEIEPSLHVFTPLSSMGNSHCSDTLPISVTLPTRDVYPLLRKICVSLFCIKAYLITSRRETS